jgi:hypothetical protein
MPVFTNFRILELGQRAITKVNGALAVIGIWYDESDVLTTEKLNPNHLGEPYDQIKYDVTNGPINSNSGLITVNFPPDKTINPESSNEIVLMSTDELKNFEELINYNAAVDRIKIISYTNNVGEFNFFGTVVFPNQVIMQYDLPSLIFKALAGGGYPYQKLYFQVGNILTYSTTIYFVTVNKDSLAYLEHLFTGELSSADISLHGFHGISSSILLKEGHVNGIAKVKMNVNLNASAFPTNTNNIVRLSYNGGVVETQQNGDTIINIPLSNKGIAELEFTASFKNIDLPINGTATITIQEINGDSLLVSLTNEYVININF